MRVPTFEEAMRVGDKPVVDEVLDRKAKPDVLVKYYIINAWALVARYEAVMKYNRLWLYRDVRYGVQDEANFQSSTGLLFSLIKYMTRDKIDELKKVNKEKYARDCELFELSESLEYRRRTFSIEEVFRIKNFVFEYLHLLNITNLLDAGDEYALDEDEV